MLGTSSRIIPMTPIGLQVKCVIPPDGPHPCKTGILKNFASQLKKDRAGFLISVQILMHIFRPSILVTPRNGHPAKTVKPTDKSKLCCDFCHNAVILICHLKSLTSTLAYWRGGYYLS